MKARVPITLSPNVIVELTHGDQLLEFSVRALGKTNFFNAQDSTFDVFSQLNQFWARQTEEKQAAIFEIYRKIYDEFHTSWSSQALAEGLTRLSKELMDHHPLEEIRTWLYSDNVLILPADLKNEYEHCIDTNTSPERTFTRKEYMELLTMSIAMRAMLPVWGEYILTIRSEIGNDFKEFNAFNLLADAPIMHSAPVIKLTTYIKGNTEANANKESHILNGITSADAPRWMLSLVVIKRLCLADIRGTSPDHHLCRIVYRFLAQRTDSTSGSFEDRVRAKVSGHDGGPESDKISSLERFRIAFPYSIGTVVEIETYLRNPVNVARRLCVDIEPANLYRSIETSSVLINSQYLDMQVTLARWVLATVISPTGLMCLSPDQAVRCIGIAEAVLWARGDKYLAILQSAMPVISEDKIMVSTMDSKQQITSDRLEALALCFPHHRPEGKKLGQVKTINIGVQGINELVNKIVSASWKPTAHPDMLQEVGMQPNRRINIPSDIMNVIADLCIVIGNRSWL